MNICTLTEAAKTQIDTICTENNVIAVTLNMKGGGCAGFGGAARAGYISGGCT